MSHHRPILTAAFSKSYKSIDMQVFFQTFLTNLDPEQCPLPPSTIPEALETLREASIRHSQQTLQNLDVGDICSLHLQSILPSKVLIGDLTNLQYYNIFSVNLAAFQQDLHAANILPTTSVYEYWILRARGYSSADCAGFSTAESRDHAIRGIPLTAPSIPTDSHDALYYLLWTRRQFLVYMAKVDLHSTRYNHPYINLLVPLAGATWKEPLTAAESARLKAYAAVGFKKFAYQSEHHDFHPDSEFPKLPPMDIKEEITIYSIDRVHEDFDFFDSPNTINGPKEFFTVNIYQEIYLRIFFAHCINVTQLFPGADLQQARWILAARNPDPDMHVDVIEEAIALTYLSPYQINCGPTMYDLLNHLLHVARKFRVDPSGNPFAIETPLLSLSHVVRTPLQQYSTTPSIVI